jgi:hypothetical protein
VFLSFFPVWDSISGEFVRLTGVLACECCFVVCGSWLQHQPPSFKREFVKGDMRLSCCCWSDFSEGVLGFEISKTQNPVPLPVLF